MTPTGKKGPSEPSEATAMPIKRSSTAMAFQAISASRTGTGGTERLPFTGPKRVCRSICRVLGLSGACSRAFRGSSDSGMEKT